MKDTSTTLRVVYPGHLGARTVVRLRDGRHARFESGQERELPVADARDLVKLGGFTAAAPAKKEPPAIPDGDLAEVAYNDLKSLAAAHDLDTSGKKADLVARLAAHRESK